MNPTILIFLGIVIMTIADELPPESTSETPIKCGINEEYTCGSACDTECATLGQECGIYSYMCVNKCRCKEGYARDYRDICIPVKYCPGNTICPRNEVYDMRIPSCPQQTACTNLIYEMFKCREDEILTYIPGCRCKQGYVRSYTRSKCIRPKDCECYQPNTIMVRYPNPCPGNTCQQPEFSKCKLPAKEWGCQCKKGYVRKSEGNYGCIPLEECKNVKPDPED